MRLLCGHNTRDCMVAVTMDSIASIQMEEKYIEVWDAGGKCTQFIKPTGFYADDFVKLLRCISEKDFSIVIHKHEGIQKLGTRDRVEFE